MTSRLAVLLSGRGSNFVAIADAIDRGELDAEIVTVLSNRHDAPGIVLAAQRGLPAAVIAHRDFSSRNEHELAVLAALAAVRPDFVCLAGYMRKLTPLFVGSYPNRIINIHPSLLPSFPGMNAQAQAIAWGVQVSGCSVHFVDDGVDTGPIIVQRVVAVEESDDEATLAGKIIAEEHRAYIDALKLICSGGYVVEGRRVKRR